MNLDCNVNYYACFHRDFQFPGGYGEEDYAEVGKDARGPKKWQWQSHGGCGVQQLVAPAERKVPLRLR